MNNGGWSVSQEETGKRVAGVYGLFSRANSLFVKMAIIGLFMMVAVTTASADTITTFNVSGTFANGAAFTGASTVTINTTTGVITASSLQISAGTTPVSPSNTFTFANLVSGGGFGTPFEWTLADTTDLTFFMPVPPDFVGFTGGTVGLVTYFGPFGFSGGSTNTVLTAVTTPEPATLALLGSGLAGLGLLRRQRRGARAPAQT